MINKYTTVPKLRNYNPLEVYANEKVAILEKTVHTVGLDYVSLKIEEGETFVCMGLSGAGK